MADEDETETETEEEEEEKEKPKSGSKKLLIIGLFVGLLLGGGGGFGAFLMLGGSAEEETVHEEEVVVVEEPKTDPYFVKIERMTLPLIYKNRVLGNVMIDFSMEVDGNENKMTVIRYLPEIRDSMLRHFSVTAIGKTGSPRNVDYLRLKKTLKDISNEVLHDPLVMEVMIVQARQF